MPYPFKDITDAIGTASSPVTLTAAYSGNTSSTILVEEYMYCNLEVDFTPATDNRDVYIQIEFSSDATNWYKESGSVAGVEDIQSFITPRVFNGASSGTRYALMIPVEIHNKHIRISIRENASSGFGTAHVRAILTRHI